MSRQWFEPLASRAPGLTDADFRWQPMPDTDEATAAVLVLFGPTSDGGDVLLIERPSHMRSHAGQPAFPGGRIDAGESPTQAALREAAEEVGLDESTVDVVTELPQLWLPPSRFKVTPVLAWWREPHELTAISAAEVSAVHRVAVSELALPANRARVQTRSGFLGPAFTVRGMLVWGFTGGVLSQLLDIGGWTQPWDDSRILPIEGGR